MLRQLIANHDPTLKPDDLKDWSDTYDREKCLSDLKGNFNQLPLFVLQTLMKYVRTGEPFAWIRWADGDTLNAAKNTQAGIRLKKSCQLWEDAGDNFFVAVGTWFFQNPLLKLVWNSIHKDNEFKTLVFLEHFYLPMGDPASDEYLQLREHGVRGWIIEAIHRKIVLIGPLFARQFEFLNYCDFIEIAEDAESHVENIDVIHEKMIKISESTEEGIIFVFIAGSMSKVLIAEAFTTYGKKDSFIDVGSALDGYAGIESKDFIDCKEWAKRILDYVPADEIERKWMSDDLLKHFLRAQ
jgi:hypothetical protein